MIALLAALLAAPAPDLVAAPDGVVRFEAASAELTADSSARLDEIAAFLAREAAGYVLIVGHSDRHGTERIREVIAEQRAVRVREELIRRGVAPHRLDLLGMGARAPLDSASDEAADAANRRVEVWIGAPKVVAWVAWLRNRLELRAPATEAWRLAALESPLRELFRVRTLEESAGEVRFEGGDKLHLGPEALVVIYGRDARPRRVKRSVADVVVERGSVFSRLAALERELIIDTPKARVTSRARKLKLDRGDRRSTVSVYQGEARVGAREVEVPVAEGFGTRVVDDAPPEPATPLAPPPRLLDARRAVFVGEAFALEWRAAIAEASATVVEIGALADPDLERPLHTATVRERRFVTPPLPMGAYLLRLTTVDARGISGLQTSPVGLFVVAGPVDRDGAPLALDGDAHLAPLDAPIAVPAPEGVAVSFGRSPTASVTRPGITEIGFTARSLDGRHEARGSLRLLARPHRVKIDAVERVGERARLGFALLDARGRPVLTATLAASVAALGPAEAEGALLGVECGSIREDLPIERRGARWAVVVPVVEGEARVMIAEPGRCTAQRFAVRVEASPAPSPPQIVAAPGPRLWEGFLGLYGGGERLDTLELRPSAGVEIGVRRSFLPGAGLGRLDVTLSGAAGFTPSSMQDGAREVERSIVPLAARLAFGTQGEAWRLHFGLAGGARFVDHPQGSGWSSAWDVFLGVGYRGAGGEIDLEVSQGRTEALGTSFGARPLGAATLRYRWWF